jgi:hypothetical protein
VSDHLGVDVHGEYAAARADVGGEAKREVAGAGADVGDRLARLELEGGQDLVRLLVRVALGILEHRDVRLRVTMAAMHLLVRARRLVLSGRRHAQKEPGHERRLNGRETLMEGLCAAATSAQALPLPTGARADPA